jgi:hypothetical protein
MRAFLKVLLFNLLAFTCLVIVIEVIFDIRYFSAQPLQTDWIEYTRRMQDPFLDRDLSPDDEYLKYSNGLKRENFRFVTNQDGLILGPAQYDKRLDLRKCDILFMGGSTTECMFVRDSLRFAYKTSRILSDTFGREIIGLNAARSGNHTFHTISNLIHTCLEYKPKVLLYMENINDLALLSKTGSYFDAPPSRAMKMMFTEEKKSYGQHFINSYLPNIYRHSRVMISRIKKEKDTSIDEFSGYRSMENREDVILTEYEKALQTLHGICEAQGIRLVLMTQFNRIDDANRAFLEDINQHSGISELTKWIPTYIRMNQLIRDFSLKEGITCIDLDKEVPHTGQYIYDQVHVNDAGSVLVSEIIAREMVTNPSLSALISGQ